MARLEARLAPGGETPAPAVSLPPAVAPTTPAETIAAVAQLEDELEFQVGQSWFAKAGILALTVGVGFLISLPHASLPAVLPSLLGFAAAAALLGVTRLARKSLEMVANPLRGAVLTLFFVATLRLYFPAARQTLSVDTLVGQAVLLVVVAAILALAWRQASSWLVGWALTLACVAALFVGSAAFALPLIGATAILAVVAAERAGWPVLATAAMPLTYGTYLVWAIGNPLRGGATRFMVEPAIAPAVLLVAVAAFAMATLRRGGTEPEDTLDNVSSFINCSLGYGLFLVHTAVAHPQGLVAAHVGASLLLIALAVLFWIRRHSHVATFFYAMTGYAALSLAIMRASALPQVFVWLSLQSVLVVATSIWFRSRFIVVANFLIFVGIVLAYVVIAERETGISLGFGIVSLVSARILNWQKERLELKTELMRNAYLLSAFIVFPYALYHLVSGRYVAVAWVGLASVYYVLNLLVRSQKYRWMGHGTLGLAMISAVVTGVSRFDPVYRVLTFLILGTVLLIVAVSFNRALRRRKRTAKDSDPS